LGTSNTQENVKSRPGMNFSILLDVPLMSGAEWIVQPLPQDLVLISRTREAAHDAVGSGALEVLTFCASTRGQFVIEFVLKRSWEDEIKKRHVVTVDAE
jgi:predicted secreted protein